MLSQWVERLSRFPGLLSAETLIRISGSEVRLALTWEPDGDTRETLSSVARAETLDAERISPERKRKRREVEEVSYFLKPALPELSHLSKLVWSVHGTPVICR